MLGRNYKQIERESAEALQERRVWRNCMARKLGEIDDRPGVHFHELPVGLATFIFLVSFRDSLGCSLP